MGERLRGSRGGLARPRRGRGDRRGAAGVVLTRCVPHPRRRPGATADGRRGGHAGAGEVVMAEVRAEEDLAVLVDLLGTVTDDELITRAVTHRSFAYENGGIPTNERLEFLGDSVLGLVVTEELFRRHPDLPEGQLAKLRAAVVNARALAEVARDLGIGRFLRLGRGEEASGGRDKSSILADAVEALIGAYYLDRGVEPARELVLRLFAGLLDEGGARGPRPGRAG